MAGNSRATHTPPEIEILIGAVLLVAGLTAVKWRRAVARTFRRGNMVMGPKRATEQFYGPEDSLNGFAVGFFAFVGLSIAIVGVAWIVIGFTDL